MKRLSHLCPSLRLRDSAQQPRLLLWLLVAMAMLLIVAHLLVGSVWIAPHEVWEALTSATTAGLKQGAVWTHLIDNSPDWLTPTGDSLSALRGAHHLAPQLADSVAHASGASAQVLHASAQMLEQSASYRGNDTTWMHEIVVQHRLPLALTAAFSGAALGGSGLITQTLFRNPLADPSLLGINAGAALGAALALLMFGGQLLMFGQSLTGFSLIVGCAFVGSMAVLGFLVSLTRKTTSNTAVLLVGVMVAFLFSALLTIFSHRATAEGLRHYQLWLMGDCSNVSLAQLPLFSLSIVLLLVGCFSRMRVLDVWLLGDSYAQSLGIAVARQRTALLCLVGALSALITSLCGPIAFVGLAAPHAARRLTPHGSHRHLLPLSLAIGSCLLLACQLVSRLPLWGVDVLPLNAITPLLGAPIVVYLLLQHRAS